MRYEQDGTDMPVACTFPVRIDPMLASKVVVVAQIVMLGYAYGDAENAVDAVMVYDVAVAVEWLEARDVRKTHVLAGSAGHQTSTTYRHHHSASAYDTNVTNTAARTMQLTQSSTKSQHHDATANVESKGAYAAWKGRRGGYTALGLQDRTGVHGNNEMYSARKRAVMMLAMCALNPPTSLNDHDQQEIASRAIAAMSRLANGANAYLMILLGGARCGNECLKIYASNREVAISCFRIFRGLLVNPSTMVRLRKQQRFKTLPKVP